MLLLLLLHCVFVGSSRSHLILLWLPRAVQQKHLNKTKQRIANTLNSVDLQKFKCNDSDTGYHVRQLLLINRPVT